jgi:hypothetical protein
MRVGRIIWSLATALAAATLSACPSMSQEALNIIRGSIAKVEGDILTVRQPKADRVKVRMSRQVRVTVATKASIDDIKPNSAITANTTPLPDGTLRASKIGLLLNTAYQGGRGTLKAFLAKTFWISGTVTQTTPNGNGATLTVKYNDGVKTVLVGRDVAVTAFSAGDRGDLKVDNRITIVGAVKNRDDALEASNVILARNNLTPPI